MRTLLLILLIICSVSSMAQKEVIPLGLQLALDEADSGQLVHLFVKGDQAGIREAVETNSGTYKGQFKQYGRVVLPAEFVVSFSQNPAVEFIHFSNDKGQPLLEQSRINTRTDEVHEGDDGIFGSYTGSGVIMGIIDAGLDLNHPDFHYPNGNTRVIELWDQNMPFDAQKTPSFGYGQIWDSAEINDGLCPHNDQASYYGHGTNTAGIAAANYWVDTSKTGEYNGHAPETELIIVSSDFQSFNFTATVADAVEYIFERAEAIGRPCVINASLGTYTGSHDGRDIPAQIISELLREQSGRIMVCAAGNSGNQAPYHLGYTATSDTNFTWFNPNGGSTLFFEAYGNVGDFESLNFAIGADKISPYYQFRGATSFDHILNRININYTDTLYSTSGNMLAKVQTYADSLNGTYRLQFYISQIDSTAYRYRLMCTGGGRIDLWSAMWIGYDDMVYNNLPSSNVFPDIDKYILPDINQSIVSSWACAEEVVTVANYNNRSSYVDVDGNTVNLSVTEGAIALSSSLGPTRLDLRKPQIAAPGDGTLTAGAEFQINALMSIPSQRNKVALDTLHHRAGGTSSASPVVAGIAALYLEKCNGTNWLDFKNALAQGAVTDNLTGSTPNHRWGDGKVDAIKTLKHSNESADAVTASNNFCDGDSNEIFLNGSFTSIEWNNGDTTQNIFVKQSGLYYAEVKNVKGCVGYSDTIALFKRQLPAKPSLVLNGKNPACPDHTPELEISELYGAYEWSNGFFTQSIEIDSGGSYFCKVLNLYGCENYSDTIDIEFFPETPKPELIINSLQDLHVSNTIPMANSWRWYLNGNRIPDEADSVISVETPGVYRVEYVDSNGCVRSSDDFGFFAMGINETEQFINLYPNPVQDHLTIEANFPIKRLTLRDLNGRQLFNQNSTLKNTASLPTDELPSGVYILTIETESTTSTYRIIK